MFRDYYMFLEVELSASQEEIKAAYKRMSIKWHPDKNPTIDTTKQMQNINEANLVLGDVKARELYDIEYLKYKSSKDNSNYVVENEILNTWMRNAKNQAVKIVADIMDEFKGSTKKAGFSILNGLLYFLPVILVYLLIRGCR